MRGSLENGNVAIQTCGVETWLCRKKVSWQIWLESSSWPWLLWVVTCTGGFPWSKQEVQHIGLAGKPTFIASDWQGIYKFFQLVTLLMCILFSVQREYLLIFLQMDSLIVSVSFMSVW